MKLGTAVIDLDPAKAERPLTAEEEAEMKRVAPLFRYAIESGTESDVIKIMPMGGREEAIKSRISEELKTPLQYKFRPCVSAEPLEVLRTQYSGRRTAGKSTHHAGGHSRKRNGRGPDSCKYRKERESAMPMGDLL